MRHRGGWPNDDGWDWSSDGTKDSRTKAFCLGVLVPAAWLVLILVNIATGKAFWLNRAVSGDGPIAVYTGRGAVAGTVLIELGVAGIFHAWFGLANWNATERYCWPVALASLGLVVLGFPVFILSVVR